MLDKIIVLNWEQVETWLWKENDYVLVMFNDLFNDHKWFGVKYPDDSYIEFEEYVDIYGAIREYNKILSGQGYYELDVREK